VLAAGQKVFAVRNRGCRHCWGQTQWVDYDQYQSKSCSSPNSLCSILCMAAFTCWAGCRIVLLELILFLHDSLQNNSHARKFASECDLSSLCSILCMAAFTYWAGCRIALLELILFLHDSLQNNSHARKFASECALSCIAHGSNAVSRASAQHQSHPNPGTCFFGGFFIYDSKYLREKPPRHLASRTPQTHAGAK
jgi:hypothetical protein